MGSHCADGVDGRTAEAPATGSSPPAGASAGAAPRSRRRTRLLPEDHLERALHAPSTRGRATWARRGLAFRGAIDPVTQVLLLHQLYLAHYVEGQLERAYDISCQAIDVGAMADLVHQDAARARQALGDVDGAAGHLRLAARCAPPSRRAFHWWSLGSVLFLAGRHEEAIAALERAARWGTTDKPLYQGHLALAKCHAGRKVRNLRQLIDRLAGCPAGQGYGRFVLGQLAYASHRPDDAATYLRAFVARTGRGRKAMALALAGELAMAHETLAALARVG